MADTKQDVWLPYGTGTTRFNPNTGEVQGAGSVGPGGPADWKTIGNVNQPWTAQKYRDQFPQPGEIQMMKNIAAQQRQDVSQSAGATSGGGQQGASYYGAGAARTAGPTGQVAIGNFSGGSSTTGGVGGGGSTTTMPNNAAQIPWGVSVPSWQTWYGQNLGKQILINGQPRIIGQDIGADDVLKAYQNQAIGWGPSLEQRAGPTQAAQTATTPQGAALSSVWANLTPEEHAAIATQMQGGARSFTVAGK